LHRRVLPAILRRIQTPENLYLQSIHIRITLLLALLLTTSATFVQAGTKDLHKPAGAPDCLHKADTTPAIQAQFSYSFFQYCLPAEVQFNDNSITNGHTITSWQWDLGDGTTDSTQEPFHDYLAYGNYTVTMTITDDSGHTSTTSMVIVINTLTPNPIVLGPTDTSFCKGSPIILDAGMQPAGVQYNWSTGDTTRTIQVNASGLYYVQAYAANGCQAYAEVNVTAKPELTADFTGIQVDSCLPVHVNFTDATLACGANVVYRRWDFDNGDTSALQNPVYQYASGGNHTITLTVTNPDGASAKLSRSNYVSN